MSAEILFTCAFALFSAFMVVWNAREHRRERLIHLEIEHALRAEIKKRDDIIIEILEHQRRGIDSAIRAMEADHARVVSSVPRQTKPRVSVNGEAGAHGIMPSE